MMNFSPQTSTYQKVHYPGNYQTTFLVGAIIISVAAFELIYNLITHEMRFIPFFDLVIFPITLFFLFKSRIITSLNGIEYHQLGYSIQTSWENVAGIETIYLGTKPVEALILRDARLAMSKILGWTSFYDPITDLEKDAKGIPFGKAIPLSLFDKDWRESELGLEIRQHVSEIR